MLIHFSRQGRRLMALFIAALLFSFHSGSRAVEVSVPDAMARDFADPPGAVRPWAYWWWVKGNVDKASITRDLEAMKRVGFAGLLMFDARGYHEDHLPPPPAKMEFMSPEWRRMLKFAMGEADRLGLRMSINLSSCAGALRGPWNVGEDAPKKLVWAEKEIEGGKKYEGELPKGDWANARDIAVLAVRVGPLQGPEETARLTPGSVGSTRGYSNSTPSGSKKNGSSPIVPGDVVDLTHQLENGRLSWDAPAGKWKLIRFAYVLMEGKEIDVDILDARAVDRYYDRMGKALVGDAGELAGKTLTNFYSVSWEGAVPTWTLDFEKIFESQRGYALRPWMSVLAGTAVRSREISDRFLRDYNKTLSECFLNNCYGTLIKRCHESGIQWHAESGGPWQRDLPSFADADQLAFMGINDMPQGEFWVKPERNFHNAPVMAAHIYGRPLAAAEAFTNMQGHWSEYPAVLKPRADTAFCDGINRLIWHTFTASPPEFGRPGIEYFAGTHLNPNVTWFEQSRAFIDYLARCQSMLQRGLAVCDMCVYTGDRPYLNWGRGEKWSDAKGGLKPAPGHAWDLINTPVLVERLGVKDGRLVLPDGMSYGMLVVDLENESAPAAALKKIAELARNGATVLLGPRRPTQAPGLADYPDCDREVAAAAEELWSGGQQDREQTFGKGCLLRGMSVEEAFKKTLLPDFEGPWDYVHRRDKDADFYFVSGKTKAICTFRVSGKKPELWNPVTGEIKDAVVARATEQQTSIKIELPENGSVFVVFRKPDSRRIGSGSGAGSEESQPEFKAIPVNGPWEVRFAPGLGAPKKAVFEKLIPWNEHPLAGIRYFSGTATYKASVEIPEPAIRDPLAPVYLDLGEVRHVAEVTVNGKKVGTVWTAPWKIDVRGAVKKGKNEVEIAVTNLWVNRLIGDAALPEGKRFTKTHARRPPEANDQYAKLKGYKADDPLERSGLMGPVTIEFSANE